MLTQISFKAPIKTKQSFSNKVKNQWISMSALFLTFMEEYVNNNIKIWLVFNKQNDDEIEILNPPANIQTKMNRIAKI